MSSDIYSGQLVGDLFFFFEHMSRIIVGSQYHAQDLILHFMKFFSVPVTYIPGIFLRGQVDFSDRLQNLG